MGASRLSPLLCTVTVKEVWLPEGTLNLKYSFTAVVVMSSPLTVPANVTGLILDEISAALVKLLLGVGAP